MAFASIFGPAFTGLGFLLGCAVLAAACLASCGDETEAYHADLTARWRRRK